MNDDYLWDRTGEPDPEVQRLEQVLGTLRYQPRPLELPEQVRIGHPKTFFPRIAIAAAVATLLVGAAAWLLLQRQSAPVNIESSTKPKAGELLKTAPDKVGPPAKDHVVVQSRTTNGRPKNNSNARGVRKSLMAGNKQLRTLRTSGSELTAKQRAEAEAAKEQLLLALRVASAKLNLAQKKAQGGYPANLIRNQHKVG